jgi:hypothetical protein
MKPALELLSQYRSEAEFAAEVGQLLANHNFFNFNGRVIHIVEVRGQETQVIEVTPEYLPSYINKEFSNLRAKHMKRSKRSSPKGQCG